MTSKYRIRFIVKGKLSSSTIPYVKDVEGVAPTSALHNFHREIQLSRDLADDRKTVLRDKIKPEDYSVQSIALLYNDDTSGRCRGNWIESPFDLPVGARNPDLTTKHDELETTEMPFMKDLPVYKHEQ